MRRRWAKCGDTRLIRAFGVPTAILPVTRIDQELARLSSDGISWHAGFEEQVSKFLFAHNTLQFPECKQRKKRAKDNQCPDREVIEANFVKRTCKTFAVDETLD